MTPDETAKRLASTRDMNWTELTALDARWLLDLLANRDARIAKLTAALICWRDCDPPHECPWCRYETEKALKP